MKRIILLLLIVVINLISCTSGDGITLDQIQGDVRQKSDVVEFEDVVDSEYTGDFSNPAFMYGSDFLSFFKILRKIGNLDEMILFTSKESIESIGKEKLKYVYENSFTNMSDSRLTNIDKVDQTHFTMHYLNSEFDTKKAFKINVVKENDSIKLIYENKYPF
jgi:hypothetical protein